jgi:hypothetical protein
MKKDMYPKNQGRRKPKCALGDERFCTPHPTLKTDPLSHNFRINGITFPNTLKKTVFGFVIFQTVLFT